MQQESNFTLSRTKIIILFVVLAVVILSLLYFFSWRPSDKDYKDAAAQINSMQSAETTFNAYLQAAPFAAVIHDNTIASLQKAATQYDTGYRQLSQNKAISHDFTLQGDFDKDKNTLAGYQTSAGQLLASLKLYRTAKGACKTATEQLSKITTVELFDSTFKACNDALIGAKSASYQPLKDQFLSGYVTNTAAVVQEYRSILTQTLAKAKTISLSNFKKANSALLALDVKRLSLVPTTDPANTLRALLKEVRS